MAWCVLGLNGFVTSARSDDLFRGSVALLAEPEARTADLPPLVGPLLGPRSSASVEEVLRFPARATEAPRISSPGTTSPRFVSSDPAPRGTRRRVDVSRGPRLPGFRLPGEFERQRALVVSCHEFIDDMPELLSEIIRQVHGRLEVVALVNDVAEYHAALEAFSFHAAPLADVHFAEVSHDTMWCRDYGPLVVVDRRGRLAVVDPEYVRGVRPLDDEVPRELGNALRMPVVETALRIEGGNLLSNGRGVCITTQHVLEANADQADEGTVRDWFGACFGSRDVVFLEALDGEDTGHVDMFATFVSPNLVVVGSYDPDVDPINAALLDRNAERLSRIRTDSGPLRVVRIPMPPHEPGVWRTYTNVVFANGVLLVPIYPDVDPEGRRVALRTFERLMPGWRVVGVDATRLVELGGAMHCVTMNLGPLRDLPLFPAPSRVPEPDTSPLELPLPNEYRVSYR